MSWLIPDELGAEMLRNIYADMTPHDLEEIRKFDKTLAGMIPANIARH
jgi:hypothetical protein